MQRSVVHDLTPKPLMRQLQKPVKISVNHLYGFYPEGINFSGPTCWGGARGSVGVAQWREIGEELNIRAPCLMLQENEMKN